MKEITKLVNEWDAFENEHPGSTMEDFCQYFLVRKRQEVNSPIVSEGMLPEIEAALGRLFILWFVKFCIYQKGDPEIRGH